MSPDNPTEQLALKLLKSSLNVSEIAAELDISESEVYQIVQGHLTSLRQQKYEAAVTDYLKGIPVHRILHDHDLSQGTLYSVLRKKNIPLRRSTESRQGQADEVLRMYRTGETIYNITRLLNISQSKVYQILHDNEEPLRRPRRYPPGSPGPINPGNLSNPEPIVVPIEPIPVGND